MIKLHDDDRGAYDLDLSAGEYALVHFTDPGMTPSAVVLMSIEVAVTVAQAILEKSAPHLMAGYRAKVVIPAHGGNVVAFQRRA